MAILNMDPAMYFAVLSLGSFPHWVMILNLSLQLKSCISIVCRARASQERSVRRAVLPFKMQPTLFFCTCCIGIWI